MGVKERQRFINGREKTLFELKRPIHNTMQYGVVTREKQGNKVSDYRIDQEGFLGGVNHGSGGEDEKVSPDSQQHEC